MIWVKVSDFPIVNGEVCKTLRRSLYVGSLSLSLVHRDDSTARKRESHRWVRPFRVPKDGTRRRDFSGATNTESLLIRALQPAVIFWGTSDPNRRLAMSSTIGLILSPFVLGSVIRATRRTFSMRRLRDFVPFSGENPRARRALHSHDE